MGHESDAKDGISYCHFIISALYLLPESCDDGTHHDKLQNMIEENKGRIRQKQNC